MPSNDISIAEMNITATGEAEALRAQLIGDGIGSSPVKATTNNADVYVTLYHAYNGKARHRIPFYMVDTREGASLLTRVFTEQDIKNDNADPKWLGKRVWYTTPQPTEDIAGRYLCPFSANADEDVKAAMNEQGFRCDCRKTVTFATRDEVDRHVEKRHPRRYRVAREQKDRDEQRARDESLATVLSALKESLAPSKATK